MFPKSLTHEYEYLSKIGILCCNTFHSKLNQFNFNGHFNCCICLQRSYEYCFTCKDVLEHLWSLQAMCFRIVQRKRSLQATLFVFGIVQSKRLCISLVNMVGSRVVELRTRSKERALCCGDVVSDVFKRSNNWVDWSRGADWHNGYCHSVLLTTHSDNWRQQLLSNDLT